MIVMQRLHGKGTFPVIFHNWRGYDCHSLCKTAKFSSRNVDVNVIANTPEKYLSLMLKWPFREYVVKGKKRQSFTNIRFIDSFQFLNTSLDNLVNQHVDEAGADKETYFSNVYSCCNITPENERFHFRKGIFPYAYLDSMEKLKETSLPPKEAFTSDLSVKGECSEEDYQFAQQVWTDQSAKRWKITCASI